jgi:membrane protein implicated in regulation of membrane protease activity
MREDRMARFLIILGLILLITGLLWPYVTRVGLGHLPGDIIVHRGNTTFYFPIVTSIILSVVLSALLWIFGR